MDPREPKENPLASADPSDWNRLIASLDAASLLLVIETRLGSRLATHTSAEDVLQDSLMIAWRDRAKCEWRGIRAFRAWLLTVIDHRLSNLAEQARTLKRGGGIEISSLSPAGSQAAPPGEPSDWSTPSRRAILRERTRAMRRAMSVLDPQAMEIVRLRVHEELTISQIAAIVDLDEAAVRRRLRKGAALYGKALERELARAASSSNPPVNSATQAGNLAP